MNKLLITVLIIFTGCHAYKIHSGKNLNRSSRLSESQLYDYNYSFEEATKQKLFGNYNDAINLFYKCISIDNQSAACYYQLAEIYLVKGNHEFALNYARTSVYYDRTNIWYQLQLAKLFQLVGKADSAVKVYNDIIKEKPNNIEYRLNLALLLLGNNKIKSAQKVLEDVKSDFGLSQEVIFSLFHVYKQQNKYKDCVKLLKEAISRFPEDARYYGLLAEFYEENKNFENALFYFKELLKVDPENTRGILAIVDYYLNIGKYYDAFSVCDSVICKPYMSYKDNIDLLISFLQNPSVYADYSNKILTLVNQVQDSFPSEYRTHTLKADLFIKLKNFEDAKNELLLVVDSVKHNSVIWEQLIFVLSSLNDYNGIYKYSGEAISYFNDKAIFYLYHGIAANQLKLYDEANQILLKGLTFASETPELYIQFYSFLGECNNALKNFLKSDFYFDKALAIDPYNLVVLNNYSYYLALRNENLNKAYEYIKRCLAVQPSSSTYLDTYGWVLFKMGKFDEARDVLFNALSKGSSNNIDVVEHYIEVLLSLGLEPEALKYYQLIKDNNKRSEHIKQLMHDSE